MKTGKFLTAQWRYLAMINYEIDPAILQPYLPRGTELDQWRNRTYISMVGFLFLDTRLISLPIPFHRNFEEINLRFYVRRLGPDGWRRGVVFIKEIVPRWAIATVARVVYNENYAARRMRNRIELNNGTIAKDGAVEYAWRESSGWNSLAVKTRGASQALQAGSEEEFITEHYWGYSAQRDGGCVEYQVEHPSWRIWQASESHFNCDVEKVYGREFVEALRAKPNSAFVAEGSPITVRKGVRI